MDEKNKLVYWALTNESVTNASAKLILVLFAYYADDKRSCEMSINEIAKRTCMSMPSVSRNIAKLIKSGHVESHVHYEDGKHKPNIYSIRY